MGRKVHRPKRRQGLHESVRKGKGAATCRRKEIYHLPLRATLCLMLSIIKLFGLDLPVIDYSQLSRRCALLEVALPRHQTNNPLHMVVDSTGVKVFGEEE
ncbi:MAG TPA: transposase [Blastocatellia bacterium]